VGINAEHRGLVSPVPGLLVNIDVPDLAAGERFYTAALGLTVGRRMGTDFVELIGATSPIYLLQKEAGSAIGPSGGGVRDYRRHWSPIHPDFAVDDLDTAVTQAIAAGAYVEAAARDAPYGRIAMLADPFGHGFCLIQFNEVGYDAITA
jgi:predicted enzyme related to lactoylglutathione lyase